MFLKLSPVVALLALAVALLLALPAMAMAHPTLHSCRPTSIERQTGVRTIQSNTSCRTAIGLGSITGAQLHPFRYAGHTWVETPSHVGGFHLTFTTTTRPTLRVVVGF